MAFLNIPDPAKRDQTVNDYFTGISDKHKHIYKDLRERGIVGGTSIIFHRYHEANVTKIRGKNLCKKITGYDANMLYLHCVGQDMCTSYYTLREKKNNYWADTNFSQEAMQWLEHLIQTQKIDIRHALNSPHSEKRIGNYQVDGYCSSNRTIYEYYGCYHHGHSCDDNYNPKKWEETEKREKKLKMLGYRIISITSCKWTRNPASKIKYTVPEVTCTMVDIQKGIMEKEIFGFIKCDIHVPDHLIPKFSEFPPIFKNIEIPISAIGEHMQEYCRSITRKTGIKRSLISSMFGKGIVIMSPLFEKYIQMGLICTNIDWFLEYQPKNVFKWFVDSVANTRRKADLDPTFKIRGETAKTKGNSVVGTTDGQKSTLFYQVLFRGQYFTSYQNTTIQIFR